jgi:hypothetical protein
VSGWFAKKCWQLQQWFAVHETAVVAGHLRLPTCNHLKDTRVEMCSQWLYPSAHGNS